MAGLLTHLTIGLIGFVVISLLFKRKYWRYVYGATFFIGQLMPDIIKFGVTGLYIENFSFSAIFKSPLFYTLDNYFGYHEAGFFFWILLAVFSLIFFSGLAFFKFMKKKEAEGIIIATILFSIGALIHLVIDLFVIEKNVWI